jgi:tripartite-type tricarboxylate transporter receptor subunit TctC
MRNWVLGLAAAAALAVAPLAAHGQAAWPEAGKEIHLIIPATAGGGTDIAGRMLGTALEAKLKTTVVVQNFGGSGGLQGMNRVVEAKPDG